MKASKKLYWLEYSDAGPLRIGPLFASAVGFNVRFNSWNPDYPNMLMENIFPDIETWQPDIVAFWMLGMTQLDEPAEWITACQFIRNHPNLQHAKIMAFLKLDKSTPEQETIWHQRYDFYTRLPLRVITHARVAKQLVGEEIKGFEGVNYYLTLHGEWKIQNYLLDEQASKNELRPDVEGQFDTMPITRLLTTNKKNGYAWLANSIQAKTPTYLVYVIKELSAWQKGLDQAERERLVALAKMATPNYQLLIGANDTLLQAGLPAIARMLEQAQRAGGWQVFINEHLWFESIPGSEFTKVVYEGDKSKILMI